MDYFVTAFTTVWRQQCTNWGDNYDTWDTQHMDTAHEAGEAAS